MTVIISLLYGEIRQQQAMHLKGRKFLDIAGRCKLVKVQDWAVHLKGRKFLDMNRQRSLAMSA